MLKIHPISDVHLEFAPYGFELPEADVYVFAGDMYTARKTSRKRWKALQEANAEKLANAVCVRVDGNHELYGGSSIGFPLRHTVEEFPDENTVILACTLWAVPEDFAWFNMNDSSQIKELSRTRLAEWQSRDLAFLTKNLEKYKSWNRVVVTHYIPAYECVHPRWAGSEFNTGFVTNAVSMIELNEPDLWIFGHGHDSIDTMIGRKTRLISNPRGYARDPLGFENPRFDPSLVITVQDTGRICREKS